MSNALIQTKFWLTICRNIPGSIRKLLRVGIIICFSRMYHLLKIMAYKVTMKFLQYFWSFSSNTKKNLICRNSHCNSSVQYMKYPLTVYVIPLAIGIRNVFNKVVWSPCNFIFSFIVSCSIHHPNHVTLILDLNTINLIQYIPSLNITNHVS